MDNSIITNRIEALTADIAEQLTRIKTITGSVTFNIYDVLDVEKLSKSVNGMNNQRIVLFEILDNSHQTKNRNKEEKIHLHSPHGFPEIHNKFF